MAMLLVPTYLAPSTIHGIGLFATVPIGSGTPVWRLDEPFDQIVDEATFARLDTVAQLQIQRYAYIDPLRRVRVLCADDARFFNHAEDANCRDEPGSGGRVTVTVRAVAEGEELTWDYGEQGAEVDVPLP
jgi:SET domain-containing protein